MSLPSSCAEATASGSAAANSAAPMTVRHRRAGFELSNIACLSSLIVDRSARYSRRGRLRPRGGLRRKGANSTPVCARDPRKDLPEHSIRGDPPLSLPAIVAELRNCGNFIINLFKFVSIAVLRSVAAVAPNPFRVRETASPHAGSTPASPSRASGQGGSTTIIAALATGRGTDEAGFPQVPAARDHAQPSRHPHRGTENPRPALRRDRSACGSPRRRPHTPS